MKNTAAFQARTAKNEKFLVKNIQDPMKALMGGVGRQ
jgi:hypothetical protein